MSANGHYDKLTQTLESLFSKLSISLSQRDVTINRDLTDLDFSCRGFQGIVPEEIFQLKTLVVLRLQDNSFTDLTESIGKLSNLSELYLSRNQLQYIPNSLGNLNELKELYISGNRLIRIPDSAGLLINLLSLHVNENQISQVPDSIGNLQNLLELDLSKNHLSTLPPTIGNLAQLKELNLLGNKLLELPNSIGNLIRLKKLVLYSNKLADLPDSIGNLINLEFLDLSRNSLKYLPISITNLNKISTFSALDNKVPVEQLIPLPSHRSRDFGSPLYQKWSESYPLHFDCARAAFAVEYNGNLNQGDDFGWTSLSYALFQKYDWIVIQLLNVGASPECITDKSLYDALTKLIWMQEALNNAKTSLKDMHTVIFLASKLGYSHILKLALTKKLDLELTDQYGWTPLHLATMSGNLAAMQCLIKAGADVNRINDAGNRMFLYRGVEVNTLVSGIQNGFDCDKKNSSVEVSLDGRIATVRAGSLIGDDLRSIVFTKHTIIGETTNNYIEFEIVAMDEQSRLRYIGIGLANPSTLTVGSNTYPGFNSEIESYAFCSIGGGGMFVSKGKPVEGLTAPKIKHGDTIGIGYNSINRSIFYTLNGIMIGSIFYFVSDTNLYPVVGFGGHNEFIVRMKVESNKCDDINLSTFHLGCTSIHLAALCGTMKIVKELLSAGSVVNQKDKNGRTAIHWAVDNEYDGIVKVLLSSEMPENYDLSLALCPLLVKAICDCDYDNAAFYILRGVEWKDSIPKVPEANIKKFVVSFPDYHVDLLTVQGYALWITFTSIAEAETIIRRCLEVNQNLAFAKDLLNRPIASYAHPLIADIIRSITLWHGRYQLISDRPEHMSSTCYVFKATDEKDRSPVTGENTRLSVALKLMVKKAQFKREIDTRKCNFDDNYVINIAASYLPSGHSCIESSPDEVILVPSNSAGLLQKKEAEDLFCFAMPLADRNLFVAIKQERFAGVNMSEVKHVFKQILEAVGHLHSLGILHADLKPLNIVRVAGRWKLIDLDASCAIGKDSVGLKSSTAYVPPEMFFVYRDPVSLAETIEIRCDETCRRLRADINLLTAQPSFDMWSLGCILYQLSSAVMLFQGNIDDNLSSRMIDNDNLWDLMSWTDELKETKLSNISDKMARNLLSRLLSKDPTKRPSYSQALAHPVLSGIEVARLVSEEPFHDVFLSYRVDCDSDAVEILYNLLNSKGYKVYWDKVCLKPGVDWERGFCEGLVNSRVFVPLLSRYAINHPEKDWQNFSKMTLESKCDNVYLEHRLAIELQEIGMIEKVFPIFIGDINRDTSTGLYSNYFASKCHPNLPDVQVTSVEEKLRYHLDSQALGTPLQPNRTIKSVINAITACQGVFIEGDKNKSFQEAAAKIASMIDEIRNNRSTRSSAVDSIVTKLNEESTTSSRRYRSKIMNTRSLIFRADCFGLRVPVRAGPNRLAEVVSYIRHGDDVAVRREIVNGYFELENGKGWIGTSFSNVRWAPVDEPAVEELYPQEDDSTSQNSSVLNPLLNSSTFRPPINKQATQQGSTRRKSVEK